MVFLSVFAIFEVSVTVLMPAFPLGIKSALDAKKFLFYECNSTNTCRGVHLQELVLECAVIQSLEQASAFSDTLACLPHLTRLSVGVSYKPDDQSPLRDTLVRLTRLR